MPQKASPSVTTAEHRELEYELLLENARRVCPDLTVEEADNTCITFFQTAAALDFLAGMGERVPDPDDDPFHLLL